MPPTDLPPLNLPAILRQFGIRPRKSLGQNFLLDEHLLDKIALAADLSAEDRVLEIGPGVGSLTRRLVAQARHVVAVELDSSLLPALRHVLTECDNVSLIQGDILKLDPADLMREGGYKVVANIPYNITSALLRHLLEAEARPSLLVLTVQQEVAQRICAGPGEMSLLAVSVQYYGKPEIVTRIPAGAFYPVPKVDSAAVRIDVFEEPAVSGVDSETFFRIAKAGFSQKRKQLRNALSAGLALTPQTAGLLLESAGIDPRRRAETLSLKEWGALAVAYRRPLTDLR